MSKYAVMYEEQDGEVVLYTHDEAEDGPVEQAFEELTGVEAQIVPMPGEG